MHGSYRGKDSQESIIFNSDNSFTLLSFSEFTDTLSYGKWKALNNFIELNSDSKILKEYYYVKVEESFSRSKDSIYISIENRLDGLIDYDEVFTPYLYFNVDRYLASGGFEAGEQFIQDISFLNKNKPLKFTLNIIPNLFIYPEKISVRGFKTVPYEIKNFENNTYKITIVDFDKKHFAYRQLKGDYMRIVDKDTLFWNNEIYVREK